jgi:Coenzyme PQQ synthesis protein D (PqqD)
MLSEHTLLKVKPDEIAAKIIEGEAILINLSTGMYYSMTGAAAFIWSQLTQESTVDRLSQAVAGQYGIEHVQAHGDVERLVGELLDEGLIVSSGDPSGPMTPEANPSSIPGAYEVPRLAKYDDMADMFALDPPLPELPLVPERKRA